MHETMMQRSNICLSNFRSGSSKRIFEANILLLATLHLPNSWESSNVKFARSHYLAITIKTRVWSTNSRTVCGIIIFMDKGHLEILRVSNIELSSLCHVVRWVQERMQNWG